MSAEEIITEVTGSLEMQAPLPVGSILPKVLAPSTDLQRQGDLLRAVAALTIGVQLTAPAT